MAEQRLAQPDDSVSGITQTDIREVILDPLRLNATVVTLYN